ncbi:PadR family transcriptional regulator [Flexithrix dorotheae]|uniref:PadR family transcriptional regulator n=1 Tax=Flexithrix dorotheae TaxID=70993 RepID=UPI0003620ABE|nr:helix-turn-helix transcriptional regulator [Flexithrix dorotheae]
MKRNHLGELEELVMLTVGVLYDNAYSVSIVNELFESTGREINLSAIHTVLYRLEEKGLLNSKLGESSSARGGKRKRLFYITPYGKQVLDENLAVRNRLRNRIPKIAFNWGLST